MLTVILATVLPTISDSPEDRTGEQIGEVKTRFEIVRETKKSVRYLGNVWTVKLVQAKTDFGEDPILFVYKNGLGVNPKEFETFEDLGRLAQEYSYHGSLGFGFVSTPEGEVYLSLEEHTIAGTGKWTYIYALPKHGQPELVWKSSYYEGGPVFRDMDGDGRCEWIFDDYEAYSTAPYLPNHILAFKNPPNGQLKIWKKYPNKYNIRVRRFRHDYGGESPVYFGS